MSEILNPIILIFCEALNMVMLCYANREGILWETNWYFPVSIIFSCGTIMYGMVVLASKIINFFS